MIAPIAKITVEDDCPATCVLYAPGLPPGEHDVYPETWEWRPIETAPKDGRTLLLGYFNSAKKWRTIRGQWFDEGTMDEWDGVPDHNPEGWYETSVENDDPPNCWWTEPTHWMPLPPPPVSANSISDHP